MPTVRENERTHGVILAGAPPEAVVGALGESVEWRSSGGANVR